MTIPEIIYKLKSFNLETANTNEIKTLLQQLGDIMLLGIEIPVGDSIIRGVADTSYEKGRFYESDISYISDSKIIPAENRASIKGHATFYGATTKTDESFCQTICIFECSNILKLPQDNNTYYEEYITMGKWRVVKPITLIALAHSKDFHSKNPELFNMHKSFLEFSDTFPDKKDNILLIAEYFAEEFSKQVKDDERYNYKISNLFAETLYERGAQGLIYPSVKGEGRGFNVVFTKNTVDNCLTLEKVLVHRVQKRNSECVVLPYLFCNSFHEDGKFKYIIAEHNAPSQVVHKMLFREK